MTQARRNKTLTLQTLNAGLYVNIRGEDPSYESSVAAFLLTGQKKSGLFENIDASTPINDRIPDLFARKDFNRELFESELKRMTEIIKGKIAALPESERGIAQAVTNNISTLNAALQKMTSEKLQTAVRSGSAPKEIKKEDAELLQAIKEEKQIEGLHPVVWAVINSKECDRLMKLFKEQGVDVLEPISEIYKNPDYRQQYGKALEKAYDQYLGEDKKELPNLDKLLKHNPKNIARLVDKHQKDSKYSMNTMVSDLEKHCSLAQLTKLAAIGEQLEKRETKKSKVRDGLNSFLNGIKNIFHKGAKLGDAFVELNDMGIERAQKERPAGAKNYNLTANNHKDTEHTTPTRKVLGKFTQMLLHKTARGPRKRESG